MLEEDFFDAAKEMFRKENDLAEQILKMLAGQTYAKAELILKTALKLLAYQAKIPQVQSTEPSKCQDIPAEPQAV